MTYQLIETKTLGTAAALIEFTSIPQTFTDLVVLCSVRSNRAATIDWIYVAFNSNISNYAARYLSGGGGGGASSDSAFPRIFGSATGSSVTANTFANSSTYVPNYTGSTNKSWSVNQVTENNATEAFAEIVAGLWSNTSAITSIALTPRVGTQFEIGSMVSLYGITKGTLAGVVVS